MTDKEKPKEEIAKRLDDILDFIKGTLIVDRGATHTRNGITLQHRFFRQSCPYLNKCEHSQYCHGNGSWVKCDDYYQHLKGDILKLLEDKPYQKPK
jgi:hypothetical protein